MAERWALVPMIQGTGNYRLDRGPKYFWVAAGPPEFDVAWNVMDSPTLDTFCLIYLPDISVAQIAQLRLKPDVVLIPANLSRPVSRAMREGVAARIADLLGDDINLTGMTYQAMIDLFLERLHECQQFAGEKVLNGAGQEVKRRRHPMPSELGDPERRKRAKDSIAAGKRRALGGGRGNR